MVKDVQCSKYNNMIARDRNYMHFVRMFILSVCINMGFEMSTFRIELIP